MAAVPHKANQYRPHLIRRYGLAAVLMCVIAAQLCYNTVTQGSVLGQVNDINTSVLLADTNHERIKQGLPELAVDASLTKAANLKAKDMFARQYWAHNAPDGTQPWKWMTDSGYNYDYAGENLARNFTTNGGVMTAWMNSPEHKDNILGPHYTNVGFAVVDGKLDGKQTTLVVAMYADPTLASVKGATVSQVEAPPTNTSIGPLSRVGIAVQSLTPAAIGSIIVLIVVAAIAFTAHMYRRKLPKKLRQSWYRHHGAYKTIGLMSMVAFIFVLYSGGQI